jgi:folate-binding protein YgfZ
MTLTEHAENIPGPTGLNDGRKLVAAYSDVRAEFAALRSHAGLYDLARRSKIVLTGSDRVRWLNGMITNNVRDLALNFGVYAFLLNPQGRIQADLYAYNRGEYLLVDTAESQSQKMLSIFDHYIIMDDVEVTNAAESLTAIGIAGPKASDVLTAAGIETRHLEPLQVHDASWQDLGISVVRGDNEAVASYELWLAPSAMERVWAGLVKAGALPVGSQACELLRIAAGIPLYGQDITERDLPQETEQARALHFNKGCYVGQEIVERIHSRGNVHRMFTGFVLQGEKPEPGTKVQVDTKDVGEITSVATVPVKEKECTVALGYIRREHGTAGKEVLIGASKAIVSKLPFYVVFAN